MKKATLNLSNFFIRLFEEIFPFIFYICNKKNISKKTNNSIGLYQNIESYLELDEQNLTNRLKEEHERGGSIDEKTSKFTLALSLSLTILAAISGSLLKIIKNTSLFNSSITVICLTSSLYMLIASIISLEAYRTLPRYGYGTYYLIERNKNGKSSIAKNLYLQEKMNIIRQIRNESAYQCIRNGLVLLFIAILLALATFLK